MDWSHSEQPRPLQITATHMRVGETSPKVFKSAAYLERNASFSVPCSRKYLLATSEALPRYDRAPETKGAETKGAKMTGRAGPRGVGETGREGKRTRKGKAWDKAKGAAGRGSHAQRQDQVLRSKPNALLTESSSRVDDIFTTLPHHLSCPQNLPHQPPYLHAQR